MKVKQIEDPASAMPDFKVECEYDGCDWHREAPATQVDALTKLLEHHVIAKHAPAPAPPRQDSAIKLRPEKVPRPQVEKGVTDDDWNFFLDRFTHYKRVYSLAGLEVKDQLLACCDEDLRRDLYRTMGAGYNDITENLLLEEIRKLAVPHQNQLVNVVSLMGMVQDTDEGIRNFSARVQGQAKVCTFTVAVQAKCPDQETCKKQFEVIASYHKEMVKHQIVRGLADSDIKDLVLSEADKPLEDLIKFIEGKESGKRSGKLLSNPVKINRLQATPSGTSVDSKEKCSYCGKPGHQRHAPASLRKEKCPAFGTKCSKCDRDNHWAAVCKSAKNPRSTPKNTNNEVSEENTAKSESLTAQFHEIQILEMQLHKNRSVKAIIMPHMAYQEVEGWIKKSPESHPILPVTVTTHIGGYKQLNLPLRPSRDICTARNQPGLADTGAQTVAAGMGLVHSLGLKRKDLIPVSLQLSAANSTDMDVLGAILITITGQDKTSGLPLSSQQVCYITSNCNKLILSKEVCRDLKIIPENFPQVGSCSKPTNNNHSAQVAASSQTGARQSHTPCGCPARTSTPPPPTSMPYPATEDNREKLEKFIMDHYKGSAFNVCEHNPLPVIQNEPLSIIVDHKVKPTAIHKPVPIPVHWEEQVKGGLDRDVALKVIEPVPLGTPVTWCSRMIIVPKQDGSPRRTVDLQALNKASVRQTHHTESPYHLATSVPPGTKKTILDCWNSFHSVALREEDKHFTTFITKWGRYRYITAPQGYLASGDGFTHRYDLIVSDFPNLVKCVDDSLLHNPDLESSFWQTCKYISLCGSNGITFNPKKFSFGRDDVEFAGFEISNDSVKPSKKILQSITEFPKPTDISSARSWFGLVNQVAFAFCMSDTMAPFRDLLKTTTPFVWTPELDKIFEISKKTIVDAVEEGVKIFEMDRPTCLATDWSKTGLGFFLLQKHCTCPSMSPRCCPTGWKLTFAGGRFTTSAESRYSPTEGEALAVADSLHKARHFILGCTNLVVATDHQPLLKLLGDRRLEEISNPRLERIKEKTLLYRFDMIYVPGRFHSGPDSMSRYPTQPADETDSLLTSISTKNLRISIHSMTWRHPAVDESLQIEEVIRSVAVAAMTVAGGDLPVVSWDRLVHASEGDESLSALRDIISEGIPENRAQLPTILQAYHQYRDRLTVVDGVIVYDERVVIPDSLRREVLDTLHGAHQGCSGMMGRAAAAVFWPGMTSDIARTREMCGSCNRSAPSQPSAPPTLPPTPEYPFQLQCADYATYNGVNYLVLVDRYSGWLSIYKVGSGEFDSKTLIKILKNHFCTFGIAGELATDGGPQMTSTETQKFLNRWTVKHRLSSAYFPHSNCRAELGVKSGKRMLRENVKANGDLDTDAFLRALMQYRNTPDQDTKKSPAQVIFGRNTRDFLPILTSKLKLRPEWVVTMEEREKGLMKRHTRAMERLSEHTKELPELSEGTHVLIQNQCGPHAKKWDRTGVVVECKGHQQYLVRVDGSGRVTLRNRKFLRTFVPYSLQPAPRTDTAPARLPAVKPDVQPIPESRPVREIPLHQYDTPANQVRHHPAADVPDHDHGQGHDHDRSDPPSPMTRPPTTTVPSPSLQCTPRKSSRVRRPNTLLDPNTYDLTMLYTGYGRGEKKVYTKNKRKCLEGERG